MNKFDVFISKNSNAHLAQYIASKQKKITRLLEKSFSKLSSIKTF